MLLLLKECFLYCGNKTFLCETQKRPNRWTRTWPRILMAVFLLLLTTFKMLKYWKTEILKYRQGCEQGRPREEVPAPADRLQPRRRRTHSHSQGSPCSGFSFRSWSEKLAGKNCCSSVYSTFYSQVKRHLVSEKYSAQIDEMYQHEEISSMWWPKEHKMEYIEIKSKLSLPNYILCLSSD